jgi:hypothetical protein
MRKAAERRRREQRARIQEIRSDMASKILSENKSGDKEKVPISIKFLVSSHIR